MYKSCDKLLDNHYFSLGPKLGPRLVRVESLVVEILQLPVYAFPCPEIKGHAIETEDLILGRYHVTRR